MGDDDIRVFVSSTVYDLVDLRAELKVQLEELGAHPVMSEYDLVTADAPPAINTIEQCRLEIERADIVLCIVSRRYGPTLERFEHPERSATHVEWEEAIRLGKRRRLFVRHDVYSAFRLWRDAAKQAKKDCLDVAFDGFGLEEDDARGIFGMVRESERPQAQASGGVTNEWVVPFTNSVDLRRQVAAYLRRASDRLVLGRGLETGAIPRLVVTASSANFTQSDSHAVLRELRVRVRNPSPNPLFEVVVTIGERSGGVERLVGAGKEINHSFGEVRVPVEAAVEFEAAAGLRVRYWFEFGLPIANHSCTTRVLRLELVDRRTFQVGAPG